MRTERFRHMMDNAMEYTFTLDNEQVELDHLAVSLDKWFRLLKATAKHVCGDELVLLVVQGMYAGSANIVVDVRPGSERKEEKLLRTIRTVNQRLQSGDVAGLPSVIRKPATSFLVTIAKYPNVPARIASGEEDFIISHVAGGDSIQLGRSEKKAESYGAITGDLQTLSSRKGNLFVVYDHIFDKGVRCLFPESMQDEVQQHWNHRVRVEGVITRYRESGIPITIRNIKSIQRVGPHPGDDYRRARGVLRGVLADDVSIEDLVREMRDG